MKKLILITLIAACAPIAYQATAQLAGVAGASGAKAPAYKAHVLSNAEFDALLARPERLLIIDVRRPDELTANGGFPVYLSIQSADIAKSLAWIPRDRTIVTVSNHAARSGVAADVLTKAGFKVAGTIGAQVYEAAGGKLTKIAVPPATAATGLTANGQVTTAEKK